MESLSLFAELLKYAPPPKAFRMSNYKIIGALTEKDGGEILFGPLVIYSVIHNVIRLIDKQISSLNKEKTEFVHKVAMGKEKASEEGAEVFQYLRDAVVRQMG